MYIRESERAGKMRVQIVENYRRPGRPHPTQRVVRHVGTAAVGPELEAMRCVAQLLIEEMKAEQNPVLFPTDVLAATVIAHRQRPPRKRRTRVTVEALESEGLLTLGVHEVFGPLFDQAGLGAVFTTRHRVAAARFREAVLLRLVYPGLSKRAQLQRSRRQAPNRLLPDHVYRMMSELTDARIERLQQQVAQASQALLPDAAGEILFLDATTLRFTSEHSDALRRKGYSKDGHPHRVQVVLAVIMGRHGLPLGYEVFPGNTADVATLQPAIAKLRRRYEATRMVVVADAGMCSAANLEALTADGIDYIMAARLRTLPHAVTAEVCDRRRYTAGGPAGDRLLDTTVSGRRLVMHYDPVRARKHAHEREAAVARAEERIAAGQSTVRTDRFVTAPRHAAPQVDPAKVARDAQFDGLHGVFTSVTDLDAATVRARYHDLWLIEQGFRVLKHDLVIRPVFHWTPPRVRAHIAICFAAFALLRQMMYRLRALRPRLGAFSEAGLLAELHAIQTQMMVDTESEVRFMVPSAPTEFQRALYEVCGLRLPRRGQVIEPPP